MAGVGINTDYLTKEVKTYLNKTTKKIENAQSVISQYKIPSDIEHKHFLNQLPAQLTDTKSNISNLNKRIDNVVDEIKNIEKKSKHAVNTSYLTNSLLSADYSFEIPDFSKYDDVKAMNGEISKIQRYIGNKLDKKIEDIDKEIAQYKSELSREKSRKGRSHELGKSSKMSSLETKIKTLESEKAKIIREKNEKQAQINELKNLKEVRIKYYEELFYGTLVTRSDFELMSKSYVTKEESRAIISLIAESNGIGDFLFDKKTGKIVSYNNLKKHMDSLKINLKDLGIDENALKSLCNKECTAFELALANKDLQASVSSNGFRVAFDAGICDYAHNIYFMKDDEVKTYLYLYKTKGFTTAENYLKNKQNELNSREGMLNALKFLKKIDVDDSKAGDYFRTSLKGLRDGNSNFFEGINNFLGGLDANMTAKQYEVMYIISGLQDKDLENLDFLTDDEKKVLKGLSANKWLQGTYEISSSIGNMLPSIAASSVVSLAATPAAGEIVGSVLLGMSAAGNSAEQKYQQGYGYWQSMFYGTLNGASEATLGYFLGGIPGLSKLDKISGLKGLVVSALREGGEESIQSIIDPYLQNIALGTNETVDWDEVKKSGLYGMITAGILQGGNMMINGTIVTVDSVMQYGDLISLAAKNNVTIDVNRIGDVSYWNELSVKLTGKLNADINTKVDTNTKVDENAKADIDTKSKKNIDNKAKVNQQSKIKKIKSKVDSAIANLKNTIYTKTAAVIVDSFNAITNKISNIITAINTSINTNQNINDDYDLVEVNVENQNNGNPVKLSSKEEVANYFGDPKLLLMEKATQLINNGNIDANLKQQLTLILDMPTSDVNITDTLKLLSPYMTKAEVNNIVAMINNFDNTNLGMWQSSLTQAELDAIYCYTKNGGFEINACLNGSEYFINPKTGKKVYGIQVGKEFVKWTDHGALEKITGLIYFYNFKATSDKSSSIVNEIDSAISRFKLTEAITVYRGINGFGPNVDMDAISVGQQITTEGYSSCSVLGDAANLTKNKNYLLEIDVPPGYNGAYIETVTGVNNYGQLEFLLKRNSTIEVTDIYINSDGKKVFKCKLVPSKVTVSSVATNIGLDTIITAKMTSGIDDIITTTLDLNDDSIEIITATLKLTNNKNLEVTAKLSNGIQNQRVVSGSKTIAGTNIEKHFAFENYRVTDPNIEVYPGTQLPKSKVMDSIEDIAKYDGITLGDKVQTIKSKYGSFSIEGVTAEAKAMEVAAEIRNSPGAYRARPSDVANEVDTMVLLTDKSRQYLNFKSESDCNQYFQDHLSRLAVISKAPEGTFENDFYKGIKGYTGVDFDRMNPYMRTDGTRTVTNQDQMLKSIKALSTGLSTFQINDDMILYRGVDNMNFFLQEHGITPTGNTAEDLRLLCGGKFTLSDNAFVSTTPVMGKGFTFKKIVEVIKAPAGTKGAYVGDHSTIGGEVEFLLQAGEMNKGVVECVEEIGNQIFVYVQLVG